MEKTETYFKTSISAILSCLAATLMLSLISISTCFADDFYWVGGTGKWSDFKNHWMKESAGTITHGRVPTFQDNVFFDDSSFNENDQAVQIDILIAEVNDLDFSKISNSVTIEIITGGRDLTVYGSMRLNEKVTSNLSNLIIAAKSKDVVLNSAGVFVANYLTFINSKDITLTTENQSICDIFEISGIGAVSLKDSLLVSREIHIGNGIFTTNSNYIQTPTFSCTGSSAKVNLMSSVVEVTQWQMHSINTFSAGNSHIFLSNPRDGYFNGGSLTYFDVTLCGRISVSGDNTIHELTFCEESDIELQSGSTQKFTQLIAEGTPGKPIRIASNEFEQQAYLQQNSGSTNVTSLILEDVHAVGGATFNALRSVDLGNVVGWNISAPVKKTFYWVGGSGNWSDYEIHWSTTSGGSIFHDALPSVYDDVIFDENSFSSGSKVAIDLYHAYSGNLDWRGVDAEVDFVSEIDVDDHTSNLGKLHVFGSFYFSELANSSLNYIRFKSDKNRVVDSQGKKIASELLFYHTGEYSIIAHNELLSETVNLLKEGTTIIEDSILLGSYLNMDRGELIIESAYVDVPTMNFYEGKLNIEKSEILTHGWNTYNVELKSDSSTIYIGDGDYGYFNGGSLDYFDVILCGQIYVSGDNTYNRLEFCPGSDIYLPADQTQSADSIIVNGDPGFPISISSNSEGQQAMIHQNGGSVDGKYLYLKDSKAIGAIFNALETVDLGNVEGWNITSPISDNFYWVGGSGLWSEYDKHWATQAGGNQFHDRIPSAVDDVFFNENSFNATNSQIEIDQIKTYTKHIDFSTANKNFSFYGGNEMWVFGSFVFNELGNGGLALLKFPVDTANFRLDSKGNYIAASILFDHQGVYDLITENEYLASGMYLENQGKVNLIGGLNLGYEFIASCGTFITNDYNLNIPRIDYGYSSNDGNSGMLLDIGSSHISVNSWKIGGQINFSSDSSEIDVFSNNSNGYFYGGGKDYQKVNIACVVFIRDDNSMDRLTITYGAKIYIEGEQTVNEFNAIGTSGNPIRINGGAFRMSTGKVVNQYLVLNNNKALGGAEFIAERSIDDGGNTGWKILPPDVNIDANTLDVLNGEPLCGQAIETTLSLPLGMLTTFKWFKNGVLLNTDSSAIVVREEGDYHVELTNACGTVAQSNLIVIRREAPPEVPKIYKDGTISICGNQPIDVKMNTDEQPRVHYNWMRNGVIIGEDDPNISIDTVGTYTIRLTKGECVVDSKDSVVVVIKDDIPIIQQLQLVGNDTICLGDSSQFFVPYEPGTTYMWNNGDTTISTQANFFEAKTEGQYTMEMENGCGITPADGTHFLKVKEVPIQQQIIVDGPALFCFYDSVLMQVPFEEEVTYQWFVNDGMGVENFSDNQAYTDTAGNYFVSMENRCGVTTTDKSEIQHIYLPVRRDINIDGDTIFCIGDSVIFSIENYSGETWVWYNKGQNFIENDERISISEPGRYSTDITNVCGTTPANNVIAVEVKEIPPETIAEDFYEICGPGELNIKIEGGEDGNYVWRDENNQKIVGLNEGHIIVPLAISKDYFVTLTNGYCEGTGSLVDMNVLEVPVADAGEDTTIIYGDELMIGGVHDYPNTYYLWSPNFWMNINTSPTPTIKPEESTVYTVEAIGINGCSSFDEMMVTVSFEVVITNTFTPNNDGTNDVWQLRNILFHPDSKIEIFNRWGTKIYEAVGYQNDWDGTINGRNLPVDTYFYVIQFGDGSKPQKGPLTILR